MPLFMDRHDLDGVTEQQVAEVHLLDLEVQGKYDVHFLTYWFDPATEIVFCLADGPSKDAVEAVHREAHGNVGYLIIEVDIREVQKLLGKIVEPSPGEAWVATAFRTIMFTDIVGSTSPTQRLGDARALGVMRAHDEIVRKALDVEGGKESTTPAMGSWLRSTPWSMPSTVRSRSSVGSRRTTRPRRIPSKYVSASRQVSR
jgi:hypothetical protein